MKKNRTRLPVAVRRDAILDAAIAEANAVGLGKMRRDGVATRASVSAALVSHYFNTQCQLRRAVVRAAVQRRELRIIAQALADGDAAARAADPALKAEALATLAGA
jgi:AcrR family transcriptional regulator